MSETKFKPGDKVRCINDTDVITSPVVHKGQVYTIKDTTATSVRLEETDSAGYWPSRFELVEEPPAAQPASRNPKDIMGESKPDLSLVPPVSILHEAMAMELGARKYGAYNYRLTPVEARTYIAAAMRHLGAWLDGEEYCCDTLLGEPIDEDQKGLVHNLGAAKAGIGIVLDCLERKTLVDNRPPKGNSSDVQERMKRAKQQRVKESK